MKRNLLTVVIGALLIVIFALLLFVFQVRKSEVAVVTTFASRPQSPTPNPVLISNGPGRSRRFTSSTSASRILRTNTAKVLLPTRSTC
ncbi:MAG: hypothetical protein WDM80_14825 [Limisphaerales bacterium]